MATWNDACGRVGEVVGDCQRPVEVLLQVYLGFASGEVTISRVPKLDKNYY